jgi:tRNA modification GTPase
MADGDTIFAPLTPQGRCSIYVVRISGKRVVDCLRELGIRQKLEHRRATVCCLKDGKKEDLDEALVVFFKEPYSFTGENVAELHIHCSSYIIGRLFTLLGKMTGVRLAERGEFSRRAFLNGKIDLLQAEAIGDLVESETKLQHQQAIAQLKGESSIFFGTLRQKILTLVTKLESQLNFPEEEDVGFSKKNIADDTHQLIEHLTVLLQESGAGILIKNGFNFSLVGAPNVGKSTLLNFLTNSTAAIVSDIPGTTRDVIRIRSHMGGIPVVFSDTAGIHPTQDPIEIEGIRRALENASEADGLILLLAPENLQPDDRLISLLNERAIIVLNKMDLLEEKVIEEIRKLYPQMIAISLKNNINTEVLRKHLTTLVEKNVTPFFQSHITRERHCEEIKKALEQLQQIDFDNQPLEIIAEYLYSAGNHLGRLIGSISPDDILDNIFSKFCLGK